MTNTFLAVSTMKAHYILSGISNEDTKILNIYIYIFNNEKKIPSNVLEVFFSMSHFYQDLAINSLFCHLKCTTGVFGTH